MNEKISNYFDKGPIFITGHLNPDGDALGASFCLKLLLDKKNIDSDISFDIGTSLPSNLDHLPYGLITKKIKSNYETVFVFDCGNPSRLGKYEDIVLKSNNIIVIDHHINPTFGTLQIIDPNAASTTQVLFRQLVKEKYDISKSMADCLLTGLITDTGRFQYSNTTTEVFDIASKLLSKGADLSSISENIYGSIEINALKLQSEIIKRIEFEKDIKFTYSTIYQKDYINYNISSEETDFMIDVVRLVKGANVALLLKEQNDGSFKGSLRSRNNFNVQKVASIFGGGGHKAASGFSSELSEIEIVEKIKNAIRS